MDILQDQFRKVRNFALILIVLFAVNAGFNLTYKWAGVSIIVRVYIMVFSFYLIFNFSQLDIPALTEKYRKKAGSRGLINLFLITRLIPFAAIYLMTALFTVITYIKSPDWPMDPLFRLMDGRFSNTLFYSLLLLLILKQNRKPQIAIPQFIIYSGLFLFLDKSLYSMFDSGYGVGGIKLVKYTVFSFLLVFDFFYNRKRFLKSLGVSLASGAVLFSIVAGINILIFSFTEKGSFSHSSSARILLKAGISLPIDELESVMTGKKGKYRADEVIHYSEEYGRKLDYTAQEWEEIVLEAKDGQTDSVFGYLLKNRIMLARSSLFAYALSESETGSREFRESVNFQRYFALYYREGHEEIARLYRAGNMTMKIWIIEVLSHTDDYRALPFLLRLVTDVDRRISEKAYVSFTAIIKTDPAAELKCEINDIRVIKRLKKYTEGK